MEILLHSFLCCLSAVTEHRGGRNLQASLGQNNKKYPVQDALPLYLNKGWPHIPAATAAGVSRLLFSPFPAIAIVNWWYLTTFFNILSYGVMTWTDSRCMSRTLARFAYTKEGLAKQQRYLKVKKTMRQFAPPKFCASFFLTNAFSFHPSHSTICPRQIYSTHAASSVFHWPAVRTKNHY